MQHAVFYVCLAAGMDVVSCQWLHTVNTLHILASMCLHCKPSVARSNCRPSTRYATNILLRLVNLNREHVTTVWASKSSQELPVSLKRDRNRCVHADKMVDLWPNWNGKLGFNCCKFFPHATQYTVVCNWSTIPVVSGICKTWKIASHSWFISGRNSCTQQDLLRFKGWNVFLWSPKQGLYKDTEMVRNSWRH